MKKYLTRNLIRIKNMMLLLNFIIILLTTGIILFATKYLCDSNITRNFLDTINAIPDNPTYVFFTSSICFIILAGIILNRDSFSFKNMNTYIGIIEIILCLIIIKSMYLSYNGLAYVVAIDIVIHMKDNNKTLWLVAFVIVMLLFTNYDIMSSFYSMVSINDYINVFSSNISIPLIVITHGLESLNFILFIFFTVLFMVSQAKENEKISNELLMVNQVNTQLERYAQITEKIGEDNERKRLAREMHDTVGHALTGIAAGIDACIAMIDISPVETKKQLFIISKVVRQGIGDVRNSLNKLRPGALEEHTFKESIVKMIEEFEAVSSMNIKLNFQATNIDFETTKEDILFRIIQESMTNALRHGHANEMTIDIYTLDNSFILEIKDNGIGCADIHMGYGLKHMKERVSYIDGEVYFDGNDGFYTKVIIPLKKGEKYD